MTVKDFLGNKIKVGDEVVFMQINYRDLRRGEITKISPQTLLVLQEGCRNPCRQFHKQVVKIEKGNN